MRQGGAGRHSSSPLSDGGVPSVSPNVWQPDEQQDPPTEVFFRRAASGLILRVSEAVGVVRTRSDVDFGRRAHQMAVVDAHSARWHAPTPARTLGRPPCVPVPIKVEQEAWSCVPPTVIAAALQAEWSLNEQLVTLHSATYVVIRDPPCFGRPGRAAPIPTVGQSNLIKKTQIFDLISAVRGVRR